MWTANKKSLVVPSNVVLLLTSDGRLIMLVGGQKIYVLNRSRAIASASMMDMKNFVLYDLDCNVISFSEVLTIQQTHFYMVSIYQLKKSCSWVPRKHIIYSGFSASMQNDGNFFQYPNHMRLHRRKDHHLYADNLMQLGLRTTHNAQNTTRSANYNTLHSSCITISLLIRKTIIIIQSHSRQKNQNTSMYLEVVTKG